MKRLLLTLVVALLTLAASAQPPSNPMRIGNRTACTIYVKVMEVDASCGMTLTTYVVPGYGVITTLPPAPGSWYEAALVADTPTFNYLCYYEKVSTPWAMCTPYNTSETDVSCCGPTLTSSWIMGGSPASPFLIIYQ